MRYQTQSPNGALFSEDDLYRYLLWRDLHGGLFHQVRRDTSCLFIMLNGSTADGTNNDPTVVRCIDYGTRWRFAQLLVANLFGWRSTDPSVLPGIEDPIGPENDRILRLVIPKADLVVCAWGNKGTLHHRDVAVMKILDELNVTPQCLGQNKDGSPAHPLYQSKDLQPRAITHAAH